MPAKQILLGAVLTPLILFGETLTGPEVGARLNGRVVVETMPRKPMPEYITRAECLTLDLVGGEVKNFGGSLEVASDQPYAQKPLFKSVNGTTFTRCNLDNVETKTWTAPTFVAVTQVRFKADPANGMKDRRVKADGAFDTRLIDGSAVAVEVIP